MTEPSRKQRVFRYPRGTGVRYQRDRTTGLITQSTIVPVNAVGVQTTWSRDTSFPKWQREKAAALARGRTNSPITRIKADIGGDFLTISRVYKDNGDASRSVGPPEREWVGSNYGYSGPLLAVDPGNATLYPWFNQADLDREMLQRGTTAIAQTIPTNPSVGVGQLIGESVQKLPSVPGATLFGKSGNVSKKFADEYLNAQFGVAPVISDIDGIVSTVRNTNRILKQLERDSGRLVRRRYRFPEERTNERIVSESRQYQTYPRMDTVLYGSPGLYTVDRVTVKRMWFSGAYSYHYQQGNELWDRLMRSEQKGNRLFGARLSPSLAWELAPWSWAADWVTNAGDVISNLSAFSRDGLVLNWGYIMCDLTITDTHRLRTNFWNGGLHRSVQVLETRVKRRLPATPYGFGLDPDWKDLSDFQLSILGALGISRVR